MSALDDMEQRNIEEAYKRGYDEGVKVEREQTLIILKEICQYIPIPCNSSIEGCQYLFNNHALRIHQIVNGYELQFLRSHNQKWGHNP